MGYENEYEFTKHFESLCKQKNYNVTYNFIHRESCSKPRVQHMDVELVYGSIEYLRLEAKIYSGSRSRSTTALGVFGSIIKGRNLPLKNSSLYFPLSYGVLIPDEDTKEFLSWLDRL